MNDVWMLLILFTFLGSLVSMFIILETGNVSFLFIPIMIFFFGFFFVGLDDIALDGIVDYSKDDIFRVMISTDDEYRNVIIEYKDVSWDWLYDNDFINDNGDLSRDPFFWKRVVTDAGVDDVHEVFTKLEVI